MVVMNFPTPADDIPHLPDSCEITANEPDAEVEVDITDVADELLSLHEELAATKQQLAITEQQLTSTDLRLRALKLAIPALVEDTTTRTLGIAADHAVVLFEQLVADDDVYIDRGGDSGGVINLSNALRHIDRDGNRHIVAKAFADALRWWRSSTASAPTAAARPVPACRAWAAPSASRTKSRSRSVEPATTATPTGCALRRLTAPSTNRGKRD